jgi:hypothetical protein
MSCDLQLEALEKELRSALDTCVKDFVATARTRLEGTLAEFAKERAKGLSEVTEKRAKGLAEVAARRSELEREMEAMQQYKEAPEGHIELNIGGVHFETSVQTLRRIPNTFFDAYFSGRYAQDVCGDGSIFVDRNGEHFGHVLEYMRDGVVSVAEPGAYPSISLLRTLKREFSFYCIELGAAEPELQEMTLVMGGFRDGRVLSSMERYDASSGLWSAAAAMGTACWGFGTCVISGELYVTGGLVGEEDDCLSSVEKYSPSTDSWSAVAPMPGERHSHAAVAVGSAMYVLGGNDSYATTDSVLKFDSTQDTWSEVSTMPLPMFDLAACAIGSNIFVFGGFCDIDEGVEGVDR